jgi:hypothetical protein
MFCYPVKNKYLFFMDKVLVYYLDPLYFQQPYKLTSGLLRDLKIMADSRPIFPSAYIKLYLFHLIITLEP